MTIAVASWLSTTGLAVAAEPTKNECIDANEAAQALRKSEKLRDAEQKLLLCVSTACPGPVRDDCAQRLTEVRAVTPTVVFVVKDDSDQDLSAVHVAIDGHALTDKLDGTALAIDPGPHRFTFEAAGRVPQERSVVVREGEKGRQERVILLIAAGPAPSTPPVSEAPGPAPETAPQPVEAPARDGTTQRTAGLAIGIGGAVGIVVGSVFGILSKVTYDQALGDHCGGRANSCDDQGYQGGQTAHSQATIATIAFVAGAALLGTGAVLYVTAPASRVAVTPTVGARSAGVALLGSW